MSFDISLAKKIYNEKKENQEKNRQILLEKVIDLLKEYFADKNILSVYIVGFLVKAYQYTQYSDIDIAIEGMKSEDFFKIYGDIEELLGTENIDLIELEKCRFRDSIIKEGRQII
ncbi:MAG: nucleotidyltransferase domain-containing protein [Spirochaetota bacterium]|nr:nucleotidyltransferase domain-containing protein [Spirochaetota bacterium]